MQIIIAVISIILFTVTTITLGTTSLGGGLKAVIIIPLVFLVVYCMARIQPREEESESVSKR